LNLKLTVHDRDTPEKAWPRAVIRERRRFRGWMRGREEAREEPEEAEIRDVMMDVTRDEQKVVEARVVR